MPMIHADPAATWSGAAWRVGLIVGLLAALLLGQEPFFQRCRTLGLFRDRAYTPNMHGLEQLKAIPNTLQCEDLHYFAPLKQVWGACQEGNPSEKHLQWFPPLQLFNQSGSDVQGTFVIIDAFTHKSTVLALENFEGIFVSHGFDLLPAVQDDAAADIYIFAVNHKPNDAHFQPAAGQSKDSNIAASQVELFIHTPGTTTARHLRSIAHPLIRTPNDIFAISPTEFYVTNDHYSRHSHSLRGLEDLYMGWGKITSDVLHVSFPDASAASKKPLATDDVKVSQALTGEHNPNGLGHGSSLFPEEVTINDAAGGILTRAKREIDPSTTDKKLKVLARKQLDSTIDNPSFFEDPYPTVSGQDDNKAKDASGYIVAGLGRGIALSHDVTNLTFPIPTLVWHVPLNAEGEMGEAKMIWQHDGYLQRSISAAVLVAIPPAENSGKKEGWLFTSGFVSDFVGVSRVDISTFNDAPLAAAESGDARDEL